MNQRHTIPKLVLVIGTHALLPDGVFMDEGEKALRLVSLEPPTDEDIAGLVKRIATRVTVWWDKQEDAGDEPSDASLCTAIGESMESKVARLPEARVELSATRVHCRARRSAVYKGFTLHANTWVQANRRLALEKLCRYGLRPVVAQDNLSLTDTEKVQLDLDRPWPNESGEYKRYFEPDEFVRHLVPLIAPPFAHLKMPPSPGLSPACNHQLDLYDEAMDVDLDCQVDEPYAEQPDTDQTTRSRGPPDADEW